MCRFILIIWLIASSLIQAQNTLNTTLIGQLSYSGKTLSDVWAHVDSNGNEYALVGVLDGTSIVDISTPSNPVELFFMPGPQTIWRDLKTHQNHAYVTNEGGDGLLVIDLNNLPNSEQHYDWDGDSLGLSSAHNLYIDNGYAYIFGANVGNGGCLILDLSDPWNPVHVGTFDDYYIHDGYVRNDTLWAANILEGHFSVIDVSDKTNPIELVNQITPVAFAHNCWLSDDSKYLFVTEEKSNAPITSYDISDIYNIEELDRYYSSQSAGVIPHNTHVLGDYIINSHYRDGLTIVDISRPDNMIEVGYYDSSPQYDGDGFNGSWGAYPFLPSQKLLCTDIENGLVIVECSFVKACYLEGNITDQANNAPLAGVTVEILNTNTTKNSLISGNYKAGYATAGTYSIQFSKAGYDTHVENNVILQNDSLTILNVSLNPLSTYINAGNIKDSSSQTGINMAQVAIKNDTFSYQVNSLTDGSYEINGVFKGQYNLYAGKWGYQTIGDSIFVDSNYFSQDYYLSPAYYDDFVLDFGWTTSGGASSGHWELGKANGTWYQGSVMQPYIDVDFDLGEMAYYTGNQGQDYYDDDIDNGYTHLSSPIFDLSQISSASLNFHYWFRNTGGQGSPPNDFFTVGIYNGIDSFEIFNTSLETLDWTSMSLSLDNTVSFNNQMQIYFSAADINPGHLVEAAIDHIYLTTTSAPNYIDSDRRPFSKVFPSLFEDFIYIKLNDFAEGEYQILNNQGQNIQSGHFYSGEKITISNKTGQGLYHLIISTENGQKSLHKLLKKAR